MPLIRRSAAVVLATILVGVTSGASLSHTRQTSAEYDKTARIHAHFDSVLAELEAGAVPGLSSDGRARRRALIAELRDYDARARFPNNYDYPEQPTPYFVDRKTSARCAVAHLLEFTGRHDIVQRVARANNNVRVGQLATDTAFTAWLEEQGITLAEAARIQPTYEGESGGVGAGTVVAVVGGSLVAVGTAVGMTVWNASGNADGHNRFGNVMGIVSGVLTTVVGASIAGSAEGEIVRPVGLSTAAFGGLSVALGLRGSARRSRTMAAKREADGTSDAARDQPRASVVPIVNVGRNASAGVSLRIRF